MSGLYVDSSAALKRIFLEAGTDAVVQILQARFDDGAVLATSGLTWVEVSRSVLRSGIGDIGNRVEAALSGIAELPLDDAVLGRARTIGRANLRSLDAIHLASAITQGATDILTFDRRMAEAAEAVGLRVIP